MTFAHPAMSLVVVQGVPYAAAPERSPEGLWLFENVSPDHAADLERLGLVPYAPGAVAQPDPPFVPAPGEMSPAQEPPHDSVSELPSP